MVQAVETQCKIEQQEKKEEEAEAVGKQHCLQVVQEQPGMSRARHKLEGMQKST